MGDLPPYEEFINTKLLYGKDSQRMYYHFVQSFPSNEDISPQTAHEIALRLAEYYKEFEVLVSTHVDCDHIHSHFIINSVSFETGKKLHQSASAIQELRQKSDALCLEYGLSVCRPKEQRTKPMTAGEYHTAVRGGSWKLYALADYYKISAGSFVFGTMAAHFAGLLACGFFVRNMRTAKKLMLFSIAFCMASAVFFRPPSFLWTVALILAAFLVGCCVAAWGFYFKSCTPKNERIKTMCR